MICERAQSRTAFGKGLAEQGVVREQIAKSRIEIEQARLLCQKAAWLLDTQGSLGARFEISAIKVTAPNIAQAVIDRAIQVHGGAGVSQDLPLTQMFAYARSAQFMDRPDEVHYSIIGREELSARRVASKPRTPRNYSLRLTTLYAFTGSWNPLS